MMAASNTAWLVKRSIALAKPLQCNAEMAYKWCWPRVRVMIMSPPRLILHVASDFMELLRLELLGRD